MNRRDFLAWAGASGLSSILLGCEKPVLNGRQSSDKPNVLFICIDDLNDWVGVLKGHPQAMTPNLDRLASEGILFAQAHCSTPLCAPSRSAVLSGQASYRSGIYDNDHNFDEFFAKSISLTQVFQRNQYWVEGAGKIFHGVPYKEHWDRYSKGREFPADFLWNQTPDMPDNAPLNGISGLEYPWMDWAPLDDSKLETMSDAKVADWIAKHLNKALPEPFFLGCGIYCPHQPWYVPQKYFDAFPLESIQLPQLKDDDLADLPSIVLPPSQALVTTTEHEAIVKANQYAAAVQGYLASIYFADDMLGRVLAGLERSPYRDRTIVVLWSDNGFHMGEKLRWRKPTLWDEATRVPLIFKMPAGLENRFDSFSQGVTCDRVVSLLDIYPTLVNLCNLDYSPSLDGNDLTPLLQDPSLAWDYPAITTWRDHITIRTEKFRYIRYQDGSEEFYDHQNDPQEWNNLALDQNYMNAKFELASLLPQSIAPRLP